MPDDVLRVKAVRMRRATEQARNYMAGRAWDDVDFMVQDAVAVNLQRACECAMDGALRWVRSLKSAMVTDRREAFLLLERAGIVPRDLAARLTRMVAFRNTLVHTDERVDPVVVQLVLDEGLDDLLQFADLMEAAAVQS